MQQLKSPFFQNSNSNSNGNSNSNNYADVKSVDISNKNSRGNMEIKVQAGSQFVRPEHPLTSTTSSTTSSLLSRNAVNSGISSSPSTLSATTTTTTTGTGTGTGTGTNAVPPSTFRPILPQTPIPPPGLVPPSNSTFPFNFPFESFRGFGGLTLAPAAIRALSEVTLTDSDDQDREGDTYRQSVQGLSQGVGERGSVGGGVGQGGGVMGGVSVSDMTLNKMDTMARRDEMRSLPQPLLQVSERVPLPTKADLSLILSRRVSIAVTAALACQTQSDVEEYLREIGLKSLISAVTEPQFNEILPGTLSLNGVKGICRLIRIDNKIAVKVVGVTEVVTALCDAMEAPLKVVL